MSFVVQPAVTVKIESASNENSVDSNVRPNNEVTLPQGDVTPPGGDPLFGEVELLLHFDGTNGADGVLDIIDNSSNAHVPSTVGGSLNDAIVKFGDTAYAWEHASPIVYPTALGAVLQEEDFCIEFWYYHSAFHPVDSPIVVTNVDGLSPSSQGYQLQILPGASDYRLTLISAGANTLETSNITPAEWSHFAWTRDSGTLRLFMNGNLEDSLAVAAVDLTSNVFEVGGGTALFATHRLDDFRFTIGSPRYTENFTPPAAPFPDE